MASNKRNGQSRKPRVVNISLESSFINPSYTSNYIRTSKYTIITFLPHALLLQFMRYANIYFLIIAILQSMPSISPLNPITAIAPLAFVLAISMIREAIEDYYRYKSDLETNSSETTIFTKEGLKQIKWSLLQVGQIVLLKDNDAIPADLVLLSNSSEIGLSFIQTSSLDGEKALKPRPASKELFGLFNSTDIPDDNFVKNIKFNAGIPNQFLNSFEGSFEIDGKSVLLSNKQLLLRGGYLKSTDWAVGLVVYTGWDTKVMLNGESRKAKQSKVERITNKLILGILFVQSSLCISMAVVYTQFLKDNLTLHHYLPPESSIDYRGFLNFWSYFLLFNTMIPISLMVTLEVVKFLQSFFIAFDDDMYFKENGKKTRVLSSTLNEELGQIGFVFSDKTGTLTSNRMEFKNAVIGGVQYGEFNVNLEEFIKPPEAFTSEIHPSNEKRLLMPLSHYKEKFERAKVLPAEDEELQDVKYSFQDSKLSEIFFSIKSKLPQKLSDLEFLNSFNSQEKLVFQYFFILCTCHEVLAHTTKSGSLIYQVYLVIMKGPSPDEITLVDTARRLGFEFQETKLGFIALSIFQKIFKFELLEIFEFNSDRKRMSIAIRCNSKYYLLVKGADNVMKQRILPSPHLEVIDERLDTYSKVGLRILLLAMRELDEKDWKRYHEKKQEFAKSEKREELIC